MRSGARAVCARPAGGGARGRPRRAGRRARPRGSGATARARASRRQRGSRAGDGAQREDVERRRGRRARRRPSCARAQERLDRRDRALARARRRSRRTPAASWSDLEEPAVARDRAGERLGRGGERRPTGRRSRATPASCVARRVDAVVDDRLRAGPPWSGSGGRSCPTPTPGLAGDDVDARRPGRARRTPRAPASRMRRRLRSASARRGRGVGGPWRHSRTAKRNERSASLPRRPRKRSLRFRSRICTHDHDRPRQARRAPSSARCCSPRSRSRCRRRSSRPRCPRSPSEYDTTAVDLDVGPDRLPAVGLGLHAARRQARRPVRQGAAC